MPSMLSVWVLLWPVRSNISTMDSFSTYKRVQTVGHFFLQVQVHMRHMLTVPKEYTPI